MHEDDPAKGGAPLAQLRSECPSEHQLYVFFKGDGDERTVVPWIRLSAYQVVSMRLLIEHILLASPNYQKEISLPLIMHGDITLHGMTLLQDVPLYISENNAVRAGHLHMLPTHKCAVHTNRE